MFDTYELDGLGLSNRIVMAPMTRSRVGDGDAPTDLTARYYSQRATAGLIVSEAIIVAPAARGYLDTPGLYTDAQVAGWRSVVEAVHNRGGRMFAQLWHCGRVSHTSVLPEGSAPMSPTDEHLTELSTFGIDGEGRPGPVPVSRPVAMTSDDVDEVSRQFASAARNAQRAGFDGVEILAANGYLFEQFLNATCNTRTDSYGGQSASSRILLLLRVLDAMRDAVGARFPIAVRLSPFGRFNGMPHDDRTEETYLHLATELRERRVAYAHFNDEPVSIGHLNQDAVAAVPDASLQRLIPPDFIGRFREVFGGTIMLCGALEKSSATAYLGTGSVDLVAFGVPFIANPDLPDRMRHDWPLSEPRKELFYGGGEAGYTDYPVYGEDVSQSVTA